MRDEKLKLVEDILDILRNSLFIYVINNDGINVKLFEKIRSDILQYGLTCKVVKTSLFKKVILENYNEQNLIIKGSIILFYGNDKDFIDVIKILNDIVILQYPRLTFKMGYLIKDSRLLNSKEIEYISKLPSKEVLFRQLFNILNYNNNKLINVLRMNLFRIIHIIKFFLKEKEKSKK